MKKTTPAMASIRNTVPEMASLFAMNSIRSLSCGGDRKCRRWYADGAMRSAEVMAAHRNEPK
ncbi:MAG TPA: hypothetical protein DIU14_02625 [Actinobacteria bacterium]|nr:hypothetical protein [Actinomycetota bacterium]